MGCGWNVLSLVGVRTSQGQGGWGGAGRGGEGQDGVGWGEIGETCRCSDQLPCTASVRESKPEYIEGGKLIVRKANCIVYTDAARRQMRTNATCARVGCVVGGI